MRVQIYRELHPNTSSCVITSIVSLIGNPIGHSWQHIGQPDHFQHFTKVLSEAKTREHHSVSLLYLACCSSCPADEDRAPAAGPPELTTIPAGRVDVGAWEALLVPQRQRIHPTRERAQEPRRKQVELARWGHVVSLRRSFINQPPAVKYSFHLNKSVQTNIFLQLVI